MRKKEQDESGALRERGRAVEDPQMNGLSPAL